VAYPALAPEAAIGRFTISLCPYLGIRDLAVFFQNHRVFFLRERPSLSLFFPNWIDCSEIGFTESLRLPWILTSGTQLLMTFSLPDLSSLGRTNLDPFPLFGSAGGLVFFIFKHSAKVPHPPLGPAPCQHLPSAQSWQSTSLAKLEFLISCFQFE